MNGTTIVELIVNGLTGVSWPLATVILAFVCKREFRSLLDRLTLAKLPGAEFGFEPLKESVGQAVSEYPQVDGRPKTILPRREDISEKDARRWSYYWLGHDLMWTEDVLYRGATKEYILHGLNSSLDHLRAVALPDMSFEVQLTSLRDRVSMMLEVDLTAEGRRLIGADVRYLKMQLGKYIHQTNVS